MPVQIIRSERRLADIPARVRAQAGRIVAETARKVEARAKQQAPVDTGFLRNSIQAQQVAPFVWEVAAGAAYAVFVEYGTSRMAAQPFFTPAVEAERADFAARLLALEWD